MARPKKTSNTNDNTSGKKKTTPSTTPKIKPFDYKFKINEFAMRGLNKYRNFMSAPECKCGCGEKAMPVFEDDKELIEFCTAILCDHGCSRSAIFLVYKNGKQEVIVTVPGYDEDEDCEYIENIGSFVDNDADAFARFDGEMKLHCYGLMIEKDNNCWEICE